MASFDTSGIDDILNKITSREVATSSAVPKMLKAAGDILVRAQQDEIRSTFKSNRTTGDLAKSIKASAVKGNDSEKYVEVTPTGNNRRGQRNATVGFVHQYGRSNMPARPWMTSANNKIANEVQEAMRKAWEAEQNG